jgi:hypothetical protein
MSKVIAAAPPSTANAVQDGRQRTRQSRKTPDCRPATINRPHNQKKRRQTKSLRSARIATITASLPAAASHSATPLRSHPDCRATTWHPQTKRNSLPIWHRGSKFVGETAPGRREPSDPYKRSARKLYAEGSIRINEWRPVENRVVNSVVNRTVSVRVWCVFCVCRGTSPLTYKS